MRMLRLEKGLSYEALAVKLNIAVEELLFLEKDIRYRPSPRALAKLAAF